MDHTIRLPHLTRTAVVLTTGILIAALVSTWLAARAYRDRGESSLSSGRNLTVKGSTRKRIESDRAVWRIQVNGEAPDLQAAFAVLDDGVNRVRDFLTQRGFTPEEVGLAAIDTSTHYTRDSKGNETREVSSYTLSRVFVVTTTAVARVSQAAGEVTALLREGVRVFSSPPEYYLTSLPDLRVELLGQASSDARRRAETIAANAGCRVGPVQNAQMGVLQVTQPFSTDVSNYGVYDTATIEKDVSAVVTVTFGINPE